MSRNTRFVIPGRPGQGEGRDLHKAMFGDGRGEDEDMSAQRPRVQMRERPANDEPQLEPDHGLDFGDDDGFDRPFVDRGADRRKGGDRRKGYSRLPDDARGYRPPEDSKRGFVILGVAIVVLGVFGAVVWNAYRDGLKSPDGAPEPELAAAGPFKTRPEGPSKTRASEEASVFERREGAPRPTQPKSAEDVAPTPEVRPAAPTPKAEAAAKPAAAPPAKPVEAAAGKPAAEPVKPAAAPVQAAAPKPAAPKAETGPIELAGGILAGGEYKPAFKAGGGFAVQLAASSTEEGAISEWTRRTAKAPDLFTSAERLIVKADVNGRTVYRVRAGSFATAADADAFCGALKARGGECFRAVK